MTRFPAARAASRRMSFPVVFFPFHGAAEHGVEEDHVPPGIGRVFQKFPKIRPHETDAAERGGDVRLSVLEPLDAPPADLPEGRAFFKGRHSAFFSEIPREDKGIFSLAEGGVQHGPCPFRQEAAEPVFPAAAHGKDAELRRACVEGVGRAAGKEGGPPPAVDEKSVRPVFSHGLQIGLPFHVGQTEGRRPFFREPHNLFRHFMRRRDGDHVRWKRRPSSSGVKRTMVGRP